MAAPKRDERTPTHFSAFSIRVGIFLLDRRRKYPGEHAVTTYEALHGRFPGLSFFDFYGGFAYADCVEGGTLRLHSQEAGHA